MRFSAEHHFASTAKKVAEVLADPGFYSSLQLPDLSLPEVVGHSTGPDGSKLRLRYEFVGHLDPIAQRLLGGGRLSWMQEVEVNHDASSGTLSFGAERAPDKLHGQARFVLEEEAGTTLRRLEGELVVRIPGIGRMAERRIVPGVLRRLDIEAAAVDERLRAA